MIARRIRIPTDNSKMDTNAYLSTDQLEAGLDQIRSSPKDDGVIELIVRRPREGDREVLDVAEIDTTEGMKGDIWKIQRTSSTPDGSANPERQITIMNARAIALIAGTRERWQLAGDQLYADLDISNENLPPGTQLAIGTAIVQVSADPHTGCSEFTEHYGTDAVKFVNKGVGRELNLRGINARVVKSGVVRVGESIKKI